MMIPTLGASGAWTLKVPFDAQIVADRAYTCQAIRYISEMVAKGEEVKNQYYIRYGLTDAEYKQDADANVAIVTLISSSGDYVHVPSSYIVGWPAADGVPYAVLAAGVVLGALPNTFDPTFLTTELKAFIKARIGLEPEITYATVSEVSIKSQDQHGVLESAREAAKTINQTMFQQLDAANARIAELESLNQSLVDFIQNNP